MTRTIQVLDQVNILDESLRVLNGDMKGFCVDDAERLERRKNAEKNVHHTTPYDVKYHTSLAAYERCISGVVLKRMRDTKLPGSISRHL